MKQKCETAGQITSTVIKQREINACAKYTFSFFLFYLIQKPIPWIVTPILEFRTGIPVFVVLIYKVPWRHAQKLVYMVILNSTMSVIKINPHNIDPMKE